MIIKFSLLLERQVNKSHLIRAHLNVAVCVMYNRSCLLTELKLQRVANSHCELKLRWILIVLIISVGLVPKVPKEPQLLYLEQFSFQSI